MHDDNVVDGGFGQKGATPGGAGGSSGGDLGQRIAKIEGLLEGVLPNLATKADLQSEINRLQRWLIGIVIAAAASIFTALTSLMIVLFRILGTSSPIP